MAAWTTGSNDGGVRRIRRDLHAFPELGFLEYRTAALTAAHLAKLGWTLRVGPEVMREDAMLGQPSAASVAEAKAAALAAGAPAEWIDRMPGGQTGIVAELRRGEGPVLALRFDMDALPVRETEAASHNPNAEGFRSARQGLMHACAHDGHTAIGLALAEQLANPAASWRGTLRLIFQPAEEGGRGAFPMVEAGILDDVDLFFAGHLGCHLPTGTVAAEARGFLFATRSDAVFTGAAAHAAASPQAGRNALLAGATAALGLHAISRHAGAVTHVNVGKMVAGGGRNIIADECLLQLEVRGDTPESLAFMDRRMMEVLNGAATMHGCTLETRLMGKNFGAANDPEAASIVASVAGRTEGIATVLPFRKMDGCDDATTMIRRVQERGGKGTYFLIGSTIANVHHAIDFDIDEAALDHGVRLFMGIVETALAPR
ncbi:amidohydrolase [Plastoroseomonas arctica]|uniref:M20 family metallo-hydrolase n=1 Tax=Plastoroseomonas arctica TaxID=1509237 RepID=A0AAF1JVQ9_9PROT|nr:amidohydrolase [Plastoroseomonas arctica]MBR0654574.1 M20 family metallo-hydrolase [Plastoroseomonas arctica]